MFSVGDGDMVLSRETAEQDPFVADARLGFSRGHIELIFAPDVFNAVYEFLNQD